MFQGECGQVSEVVVESVNGEVLVSVSEQLYLTWSTTTHMTFLTLGQEVMDFITSITPPKGNAERERERKRERKYIKFSHISFYEFSDFFSLSFLP